MSVAIAPIGSIVAFGKFCQRCSKPGWWSTISITFPRLTILSKHFGFDKSKIINSSFSFGIYSSRWRSISRRLGEMLSFSFEVLTALAGSPLSVSNSRYARQLA